MIFFFGLYTRLRLGDVARLTWANVDLDKQEIRLVTQKTGLLICLPSLACVKRKRIARPPAKGGRAAMTLKPSPSTASGIR